MSSEPKSPDATPAPPLETAASRTRRSDGVRTPTSERVAMSRAGRTIEGWALNVSRGGLRVVLEQPVQVGDQFDLSMGDAPGARPVRIVWVRTEKGGAVVGVSFTDGVGSVPPPSSVSRPPQSER